jgi:hypothetical protein
MFTAGREETARGKRNPPWRWGILTLKTTNMKKMLMFLITSTTTNGLAAALF